MPYYQWQGITIDGTMQKGALHARNVEELDALLLKRNIALLKSAPKKYTYFQRRITVLHIIHFYKQLALLLESGVLLPDALHSVYQQIDHPVFQEIIGTVSGKVHNGIPLSSALGSYPAYIERMNINIITVGEQAGILDRSLSLLVQYKQEQYDFKKQLQTAALLPAITFFFFCAIALAILVIIIPQFASLFSMFGCQLPAATQWLIAISVAVRSWYAIYALVVAAMVIVMVRSARHVPPIKENIDRWFLKMPLLCTVVVYHEYAHFFRSLGLLLQGGVSLLSALHIATETINNSVLKKKIAPIQEDVFSGVMLSDACAYCNLFSQDIIALLSVGERSGMMNTICMQVATVYQQKVKTTLTMITTMVQPLLMIILGGLIGLLIVAVYMPIVQLSHHVQ